MQLKFWGTRGSVPTPYTAQLRHGGNTPCLEVVSDGSEDPVIIDCGTGGCSLGEHLQARNRARRIHILLTHFHWDHIQGIPYFVPLFDSRMEVIFYANRPEKEIRSLLQAQMSAPFHPIAFEDVPARIEFRTIEYGRPFQAGGVLAECFPLNHPQGATGYRLDSGRTTLVHASDHECGNADVDAWLSRVSHSAHLLVMDSQYTPEEYALKAGWGHSSFEHATEMAKRAKVSRLALFHHDPAHDDSFLDVMLSRAQEHFEHTIMACERETLDI